MMKLLSPVLSQHEFSSGQEDDIQLEQVDRATPFARSDDGKVSVVALSLRSQCYS